MTPRRARPILRLLANLPANDPMDDFSPGSNADAQARLQRLLGYLHTDPANHALLTDALNLALSLRNVDAAARIAAQADALPARPQMLAATLCLFHLQQQQHEQAYAFGREACSAGQPDPVIHYNTAWAALNTQRFAETCALLDECFPSTESNPPEVNLLYARALHHLDKTDAALLHLPAGQENTIADPPLRAEFIGVRALLLVDNGDAATAREAAERALQLNPAQAEALLALAEACKDLGEYEQAVVTGTTLAGLRPEMGRAWSTLAQAHLARFSLDEAEQCAQQAVTHMRDHIGSWHVLGWISLLKGDTVQARNAFAASLPLERGFADTHGALAAVDLAEGKLAEGEQRMRLAERLDKQSPALQYARFLHLMAQDATAAQRHLEATLDRQPPGSNQTLLRLIASHMATIGAGQTRH